jgi:D-arabinose 1-dehydrogenase-like Zn-dependent alcohol dehydrogenase
LVKTARQDGDQRYHPQDYEGAAVSTSTHQQINEVLADFRARINCKDLTINLNEILVPTPTENQLLVKILCASLCYSDIMIFEPNDALQRSEKSITMGHEATGTVVAMGAAVSGFKEGDNVGFIPGQNVCYECHACRNV